MGNDASNPKANVNNVNNVAIMILPLFKHKMFTQSTMKPMS